MRRLLPGSGALLVRHSCARPFCRVSRCSAGSCPGAAAQGHLWSQHGSASSPCGASGRGVVVARPVRDVSLTRHDLCVRAFWSTIFGRDWRSPGWGTTILRDLALVPIRAGGGMVGLACRMNRSAEFTESTSTHALWLYIFPRTGPWPPNPTKSALN